MEKILKKILEKIARPITNKVLKFRGKHEGESCYIFADGISVKWFDLEALPKRIGFGLNRFPFHKQSNSLNLKYGIHLNSFYFYPYIRLPAWGNKKWWRNKIKDKDIDLFKKNKKSDYFVSLSNYPTLRGNNIYHLFRKINDPNFEYLQECYTNEIGIYDGSLHAAISLAIYMGFEDIVLVGCDYTHENSRMGHWYEKGEGIILPYVDYEKKFFNIASKYANIKTITLDGGSSVLPSITYSKYTGRPLCYHENHEITDIETLKLLATWPDYKIF
jgi:hypothetical protein